MGVRTSTRLAISLLAALPKNALSRAAGGLADRRLPGAWRAPVCRAFGRAVGVDFDEVRDPLESFESLQAFFTRALRPGVRPVDPAPDALLSPCDGRWGASGQVVSGLLLQIKGRPYSLSALLGSAAEAEALEGAAFATLYLSPRDYHRFHAPCAMQIRNARHLPGDLWPVNGVGVEGVPGLFAENERIVARFQIEGVASESLTLVAVGATMVGRIRVDFDDLVTNRVGAVAAERHYGDAGARYDAGQEWADDPGDVALQRGRGSRTLIMFAVSVT